MPNLYNKLMAKDMPGAAPAPTARQMVQSPMGLRSAMKRYADGGDITVAPPMVTSAVPDYSRAYGALGGAEGVNALRNQLLGMGISEDVIGSALSKYYAPEPKQGVSPQTMTPPPPPEPRYEEPRPEPRPEPLPEPVRPISEPVKPEIYPVGTREEDERQRNLDSIAKQRASEEYYWKMVNAKNPPPPSAPEESTMTLDDGTVIQGYQGIGTPEFFAHYANDPMTMAKLREVYGFTGDQPEYQQPQIGYNAVENVAPQNSYGQMENVAPQIPFDPADIPTNGYNEPEVNYQMPDPQQTQSEDARLALLKKALSGQGVGSLADSQKLTQLLQSLGYSK
jgi:hypothetical protein